MRQYDGEPAYVLSKERSNTLTKPAVVHINPYHEKILLLPLVESFCVIESVRPDAVFGSRGNFFPNATASTIMKE